MRSTAQTTCASRKDDPQHRRELFEIRHHVARHPLNSKRKNHGIFNNSLGYLSAEARITSIWIFQLSKTLEAR